MGDTVDDFFNEINEIAPPKACKQQNAWQECFDKLTGYSYYWNTKTDAVSWERPSTYTSVQEQLRLKNSQKKNELYIPPRAAPPLFPGSGRIEDRVKIYSIQQNINETAKKKNTTNKTSKKKYSKHSDSEDEKIELITSFGDDSESEPDSKTVDENNIASDEDDDIDILTKIQKRTMELKKLGGQLPPELSNTIKPPPKKENIAGFSLVAGYSDSEDSENEEVKSIFPVVPPESPKVSHSTLFPITKPVDIKDFIEPTITEEQNKPNSPSLTPDFESKAFQRKRRIGVSLVNKSKKIKDDEGTESERKGFGFETNKTDSPSGNNTYPGFTKGGVMFVKSDVLNPSLPEDESKTKEQNEVSTVRKEEMEDVYCTLKEKLTFLCEGREPVLPVQVMLIQAETLFTAMKEDGLKLTYLQRWLNENCSYLIKLEKEAAPDGWLLQWDRSHKRYYYQNQASGEGQWEYPQPDVMRCDDAMDISTTPPPTEPPAIHMSPPLPPTIRSPTPPPPPVISGENTTGTPDVPLPPEPTPSTKYVDNGEPLPPGVDLPELICYSSTKETEKKEAADPLNSALDSFYSEIAATENTNSCSPPPPPLPTTGFEQLEIEPQITVEGGKKKRKTKVKLAPGLSMKKKGVSLLVEKWKSVQKTYND